MKNIIDFSNSRRNLLKLVKYLSSSKLLEFELSLIDFSLFFLLWLNYKILDVEK